MSGNRNEISIVDREPAFIGALNIMGLFIPDNKEALKHFLLNVLRVYGCTLLQVIIEILL